MTKLDDLALHMITYYAADPARIQHFIQSGDVTVLFVSHSMEQVERICQRAVWIEKGDLRMDGPVDEVCKAYREQFN